MIIGFMPFVVNAQDAPQRTLIPMGINDHTRFVFLILTAEDAIRNYDANINPAPLTSATSAQLLSTPSTTITELQTPTPTPSEPIDESISGDQSIKHTPAPIEVPPPANPNWINIMVGVVLISVIIIIVGVWINRGRVLD